MPQDYQENKIDSTTPNTKKETKKQKLNEVE